MPLPIQKTILTDSSIDLIIANALEIEAAKLWIQVRVSQPVNQARPLAVLQAIALRDARNEISEQIRAITQTHGPVP